jgi:hypothetical protein
VIKVCSFEGHSDGASPIFRLQKPVSRHDKDEEQPTTRLEAELKEWSSRRLASRWERDIARWVRNDKEESPGRAETAGQKLRPVDVLVVDFCGHATQIARRRSDGTIDGTPVALCTFDANPRGENVILCSELGVWLDDIRAAQITVLLDYCHAGTGTKEANDEIAYRYLLIKSSARDDMPLKQPWRELRSSTKLLEQKNLVFFFAWHPEQQAYERQLPGMKAPARVGQFTHYYLEGPVDAAADVNHDGVISNHEALGYVKRPLDESYYRSRSGLADRQEPLRWTVQLPWGWPTIISVVQD